MTNQVNDTSYLKLFPSFFVQQQLNEKNSLNFRYSYRIGRPGYHRLNPFKWMVDPYTYNVGNLYLKPQFTHAAGLSHNFKGALSTTVLVRIILKPGRIVQHHQEKNKTEVLNKFLSLHIAILNNTKSLLLVILCCFYRLYFCNVRNQHNYIE